MIAGSSQVFGRGASLLGGTEAPALASFPSYCSKNEDTRVKCREGRMRRRASVQGPVMHPRGWGVLVIPTSGGPRLSSGPRDCRPIWSKHCWAFSTSVCSK